jgi:nucleotide-binding universal stress UspA family protein
MDRGPIVDTILAIAKRTESDLIILGSRTHGAFFQLAPRSIVKGIIGRSRCPVLVIPQLSTESEGALGGEGEGEEEED